MTEAGVGWPGWLKVVLTVLMVAPPAFFMGIPLPTGLRLLQLRHEPSVKWAWAINSASSVLGSVGAMFLAIYEGLQRTLLVGGGFYVLALLDSGPVAEGGVAAAAVSPRPTLSRSGSGRCRACSIG